MHGIAPWKVRTVEAVLGAEQSSVLADCILIFVSAHTLETTVAPKIRSRIESRAGTEAKSTQSASMSHVVLHHVRARVEHILLS